jgi:hypothetical protein
MAVHPCLHNRLMRVPSSCLRDDDVLISAMSLLMKDVWSNTRPVELVTAHQVSRLSGPACTSVDLHILVIGVHFPQDHAQVLSNVKDKASIDYTKAPCVTVKAYTQLQSAGCPSKTDSVPPRNFQPVREIAAVSNKFYTANFLWEQERTVPCCSSTAGTDRILTRQSSRIIR